MLAQSSELDLRRLPVRMQAVSTVLAPDTLLTLATPQGPTGNDSLSPLLPVPGETSRTNNVEGRVLRSSWIQRLKPGDEVEPTRVSSAELICDRTCLGGRRASHLVDTTGQASMQTVHERTDGLAETQHSNRLLPGIGPWIHLSSTNCSVGKLREEPHRAQSSSIDALRGAMTTHRPTLMEDRARPAARALSGFNTPCRRGERNGESVALMNTAKPPLPPRNKPSLFPKPVIQKDHSSSFTGNPTVAPSSNVEVCKGVASGQTSLISLAALPSSSDGRLIHCSNDMAGPSLTGSRLLKAGFSSSSTSLMYGGNPKAMNGAIEITGQAPHGCLFTGAQLGGEVAQPNSFVRREIALQTAAKELDVRQSLTENFGRTIKDEEAQGSGPSSSTSASFPWEEFVETDGASKKVREQLVEVYNKARDELKRTSHGHSKAPERAVVGSPRIQLGKAMNGCIVVADKLSSESGPVQAEGLSENLNLGSGQIHEPSGLISNNINEHNTREQVANKQNAAGFVESNAQRNILGEASPRTHKSTGAAPAAVVHMQEFVTHEKPHALHKQTDLSEDWHIAGGLGKRPRAMFEAAISSSIQVGRVLATRREKPPSRPDVWLQRWHPTLQISRGSQHLPSNEVSNKLDRLDLPVGTGADHCEFSCKVKRTWLGNISFSNLDGCEQSKMHSSNLLPSAAAMAIVGTAARQFCSTQPQRKGSFAFWSGFGMYADKKTQAFKDKGKGKA